MNGNESLECGPEGARNHIIYNYMNGKEACAHRFCVFFVGGGGARRAAKQQPLLGFSCVILYAQRFGLAGGCLGAAQPAHESGADMKPIYVPFVCANSKRPL
jgi:hypothetical protein